MGKKQSLETKPQSCMTFEKGHRNARGNTPKKEKRTLDGLPNDSRQNNGVGSLGKLNQYES